MTLGSFPEGPATASSEAGEERPVLRTRLCDVLGVDYPIVQSGMGGVAGVDLCAAVSDAGGLGILASTFLDADTLRDGVVRLAARGRPFGVNVLLSSDLMPPATAADIGAERMRRSQAPLDELRRHLDLPSPTEPPRPPPDFVPVAVEVLLDHPVPVFSVGLGNPGADLVEELHRRGTKVIAMVTTLADALATEAAGVDAVIAQGWEAGGHRSHFRKAPTAQHGAVGTMALVPEVAAALRIPVIAAGGIGDGRGLVAALALGADGVLMGTRFVATAESMASTVYKKAILERSSDDTAMTDGFSGRWARTVRNTFAERYLGGGEQVLPFMWQIMAASDIYAEAAAREDPELQALWAGQVMGIIDDLPTAADVVEDTVREARALLDGGLRARIDLGPIVTATPTPA